ncbi:MAG: putative porin [Lutibacter sp.]|uniref:putative porin n=1 Tax=Lutibacter sp. TaxID=1925666 RepID=UPI00385D5A05
MKQLLFVVFLTIFIFDASAQREQLVRSKKQLFQNDTTSFNEQVEIKLDGLTKYTDYKIISIHNDTTVVDTTLTLQKDFKFNYLRKDNFELLPFHNQGQTYNKLGYDFEHNSLLPTIGANAKQFNYFKTEDISYYEVPTPTSEIMYKTGLEQGQVLDAFLTMNTSRQFNFSIAYKGLRSLGKYRYSLASHGNFRATFNYHSKNKKYFARGHFSSFDLLNNENGGLTPESIAYFEINDPNYTDRARLDVNFTDAENLLEGKRYYFEQEITLFSKKNKIEEHNLTISTKLKKYNAVQKQIDALKNRGSSNSRNQKGKSLIKGAHLTKKSPIKEINNINKTNKVSVNQLIEVDSLTMKTISSIKNVIVKNDSISQKNTQETDSLTLKKILKNNDSIVKLDSAAIERLKKIDSLEVIATKIKTDSSQLITLHKSSYFNAKFGHHFMYETKHYRFKQASANDIFGDAFESSIVDHTSYQKLDNQFYVQLNSPYTGSLKATVNYYNYNYHYNSILFYDSQTIADKIKGNAIAVGGEWKTQFGNVSLNADASSIIIGDITGSSLKASAMIKKDSVYSFKGFAEFTSKTPDFNKLLYQSDYLNYNWQTNFTNEEISTIGVEFTATKWGNLKASYHLIDNYTYFNENSKPTQATETLNYIKVKASKAFTYKKFTLDNTVMYQNVSKGEAFFRVPEVVTRNTFYYSSYVFKGKPMYLQTGVTFKYFTSFKANAYNPLLSEFTIQNNTEIGNFPVIDFFANAQIRRTRIFLKVENLNASFTGRTYYSAPNYPYRDLTVRFGIVWNWFI